MCCTIILSFKHSRPLSNQRRHHQLYDSTSLYDSSLCDTSCRLYHTSSSLYDTNLCDNTSRERITVYLK